MTTPRSRELMDVVRVIPELCINKMSIPKGPAAVNLGNDQRISMILKSAGNNGSSEMAAGVGGATADGPIGCLATSSLYVTSLLGAIPDKVKVSQAFP